MKCLLIVVGAFALCGQLQPSHAENTICDKDATAIDETWQEMETACVDKMHGQIKMEFQASMFYIALGAYFARDDVARPGFSKMFYEAAAEEREHGVKLIEYLSMRGRMVTISIDPKMGRKMSNLSQMIPSGYQGATEWEDVTAALKAALHQETLVTASIRDVIKQCELVEDKNDYHLVDYLTGVYLEEQHKGQRDLVSKITTLAKMNNDHGKLGEFIYDKNLL